MVVSAKNYKAKIQKLPNGSLFMKRWQSTNDEFEYIVDTFANHWLFFKLDKTSSKIFIRNNESWLNIKSNDLVICKPFSIVNWKIQKGLHEWSCYVFENNIIKFSQIPFNYDDVMIFDTEEQPFEMNEQFSPILIKIDQKKICSISSQHNYSVTALKTKLIIDANYFDLCKVGDIAKKLLLSRVAVTKAFKKAYNITPVEYRTRLRIFEALKAMNRGTSILDAQMQSGFNDSSEFILQFKKILGVTPSKYKLRKV